MCILVPAHFWHLICIHFPQRCSFSINYLYDDGMIKPSFSTLTPREVSLFKILKLNSTLMQIDYLVSKAYKPYLNKKSTSFISEIFFIWSTKCIKCDLVLCCLILILIAFLAQKLNYPTVNWKKSVKKNSNKVNLF